MVAIISPLSIFCVQVVPIPISKAADVRRYFNLAAKKFGFEFEVVSPGEYFIGYRKASTF